MDEQVQLKNAKLSSWKANWIWDRGTEKPENYWLCFRYTFSLNTHFDKAIIRISADSRYTLYINGNLIGKGPERSWPFKQIFDSYREPEKVLKKGENVIAVLVNHFGISTSQYVQGRGGLLCQLDIYNKGHIVKKIFTNENWKTRRHRSFSEKSIRINIARPWIEIFDARKFPENWYKNEYDDSSWVNAKVIGKHNVRPWLSLQEWKYERLKIENFPMKEVKSINYVKPIGNIATINFGKAVSNDTFDNRDKKLLGYLFTYIISSKEEKGIIRLLPKKINKTSKRLIFNDKAYEFNENYEITLDFNKGKNFFLFDLSGYYQTLDLDFLFITDNNLEFSGAIFNNDTQFLLIGPMEFENIFNVMAIDKKLDFENQTYLQIWNHAISGSLENFLESNSNLLKAIPDKYILYNNPHLRSIHRKIEKKGRYKLEPHGEIVLFPNSHLDIEVILDFGEEVSGYFGFDIDSEPGVTVDIEFSENIRNMQIEYPMDTNSAIRYITKAGKQSYKAKNRNGFRYAILTIRGLRKIVRLNSIHVTQELYPVNLNYNFSCSDEYLNKIWEISRRTLHLCMEDAYVDCPAYEQALWLGDARLEALFNYYLFGKYELTKHYNRLTIQSLERSKLPECQVPTGNPTILTAWVFLWIFAVKEYYIFSGDLDELYYIYPYIIKIIEELKRHLKDNLLSIHAWNMFDWAAMDTPTDGIVTHLNALFIESLRVASFISATLNEEKRKKEYLILASKITKALNENLWDNKHNAFIDCIHKDGTKSSVFSIQTNMLAYLYNCVEGLRKERIEKHLLELPDYFIKPGSPFSYFFYLEALAKMGEFKRVFELIKVKWGEMLDYDATTCWETFKGWEQNRLTRSHCHGWSVAPAYFIGAYILGVRPIEAGFKKFIVKPETCGLEWASGYVPTPHGPIYVEWSANNGNINIDVKAPPETEYEIIPGNKK